MYIKLITVGKIKESYYRDAVAEYEKRMKRYGKFSILEVEDEATPDHASPAQEEQIKKKEAERILKQIKQDAYVITLEIKGKKYDSVAFAKRLEEISIQNAGEICFIIGGSLGLHESVSKRANEKISFSDMTFPHQLMRVILSEQIYRGMRIIQNEPYHK